MLTIVYTWLNTDRQNNRRFLFFFHKFEWEQKIEGGNSQFWILLSGVCVFVWVFKSAPCQTQKLSSTDILFNLHIYGHSVWFRNKTFQHSHHSNMFCLEKIDKQDFMPLTPLLCYGSLLPAFVVVVWCWSKSSLTSGIQSSASDLLTYLNKTQWWPLTFCIMTAMLLHWWSIDLL